MKEDKFHVRSYLNLSPRRIFSSFQIYLNQLSRFVETLFKIIVNPSLNSHHLHHHDHHHGNKRKCYLNFVRNFWLLKRSYMNCTVICVHILPYEKPTAGGNLDPLALIPSVTG